MEKLLMLMTLTGLVSSVTLTYLLIYVFVPSLRIAMHLVYKSSPPLFDLVRRAKEEPVTGNTDTLLYKAFLFVLPDIKSVLFDADGVVKYIPIKLFPEYHIVSCLIVIGSLIGIYLITGFNF